MEAVLVCKMRFYLYNVTVKPMTTAFAAKFMETRKTKDFSWHKNFKESLTARKEEEHTVKQGYLTLMLP